MGQPHRLINMKNFLSIHIIILEITNPVITSLNLIFSFSKSGLQTSSLHKWIFFLGQIKNCESTTLV